MKQDSVFVELDDTVDAGPLPGETREDFLQRTEEANKKALEALMKAKKQVSQCAK